jgi:5-methylcytosine-specific restriction endonuclease McrA
MSCRKEYMKKYRLENKEKIKRLQKEYYETNKETLKENMKSYYFDNREERRAKGKEHYENNKSNYLAYSKTRKAMIKNRTPSWLTEEDYEKIVEIYILCKKMSDETGIQHHVDHIIPLNGKTVSGFHVPWNLQILTASENLSKGNKHEL